MLDLVIRGGTVVDGSGEPGVQSDLAINNGQIVEIGEVRETAVTTWDAAGHVVCPGFVDIHTHYDAQLVWDRMMSISPWHGVTTAVVGNCGFGVAPTRPDHRQLIVDTLEKVEGMSAAALTAGLGNDWGFESFPEYLDCIERRGVAINVAALIGHTPVRLNVMGEEAAERSATEGEILEMREIVARAMEAGAIGFATSKSTTHVGFNGQPVPSRLSEFPEILELVSVLADVGRGIVQVTIGKDLFFPELAKIARKTGGNVSWTALLGGMAGPGGHRKLLESAAKQQADGLPIYPQVSCRPFNFEFQMKSPFLLETLSAFSPISAADLEGKKRIYADPRFRAAFKEEASGGFATKWDQTVIATCQSEPELEERILSSVAEERGIHPIDLLLDLSLASALEDRFRMAVLNSDESEVEELLRHPTTMIGLSDAGAHASQLCDAGFATHLLGHWVRERKAISLESAVKMLTSRPADIFGIEDRGLLAVGRPADVVVFDPAQVGAGELRRVNDLPGGADRLVCDASGIELVVVNGQVLRRHGSDVLDADGPLPGRLLRAGRASDRPVNPSPA